MKNRCRYILKVPRGPTIPIVSTYPFPFLVPLLRSLFLDPQSRSLFLVGDSKAYRPTKPIIIPILLSPPMSGTVYVSTVSCLSNYNSDYYTPPPGSVSDNYKSECYESALVKCPALLGPNPDHLYLLRNYKHLQTEHYFCLGSGGHGSS